MLYIPLLTFSRMKMLRLNAAQRSFIRNRYKKTKGSYTTIAQEFTSKFNAICPPIKVVRAILADEEEVDERIIRDVFLSQFSPAKRSKARRLSNSLTSLQHLRNAAVRCSHDFIG